VESSTRPNTSFGAVNSSLTGGCHHKIDAMKAIPGWFL
jgi:hypothetical protein